jgi:ketosteroid isomerase-like protein
MISHKNSIKTFLAFVKTINEHNVDGLVELMSKDHLFIDSLGKRVRGKETMYAAWKGYFALFPDYKIICTEIFQKDDIIAALGSARGTYLSDGKLLKDRSWRIPAAWRARIRNNKIKEWQVFADNEPVRRIMAMEHSGITP